MSLDVNSNKNGTKICPYCKEEIKEDAIKCRYCHSKLTSNTKWVPWLSSFIYTIGFALLTVTFNMYNLGFVLGGIVLILFAAGLTLFIRHTTWLTLLTTLLFTPVFACERLNYFQSWCYNVTLITNLIILPIGLLMLSQWLTERIDQKSDNEKRSFFGFLRLFGSLLLGSILYIVISKSLTYRYLLPSTSRFSSNFLIADYIQYMLFIMLCSLTAFLFLRIIYNSFFRFKEQFLIVLILWFVLGTISYPLIYLLKVISPNAFCRFASYGLLASFIIGVIILLSLALQFSNRKILCWLPLIFLYLASLHIIRFMVFNYEIAYEYNIFLVIVLLSCTIEQFFIKQKPVINGSLTGVR